jgi:enamine deaminase RidA (YjgF/YER057c/UK114 family)
MIIRTAANPPRTFSESAQISGPGTLVFISGHVGSDAEPKPSDFRAEVKACFARISGALRRVGADWKDVARIDAYLTDLSAYETYADIRGEIFQETPPASTAVQVAGLLSGATIEINAIAFLSETPQ